jgi:hypothetical protein
MDIDAIDGFKKKQKFNKKYYKYEKKKPDVFMSQLLSDIKHNGNIYIKSYLTLQELLKYEPNLSYVWIKDDNMYLVRIR